MNHHSQPHPYLPLTTTSTIHDRNHTPNLHSQPSFTPTTTDISHLLVTHLSPVHLSVITLTSELKALMSFRLFPNQSSPTPVLPIIRAQSSYSYFAFTLIPISDPVTVHSLTCDHSSVNSLLQTPVFTLHFTILPALHSSLCYMFTSILFQCQIFDLIYKCNSVVC